MKHRWWLIQATVYIIMCGDVLMNFGDLNVSDFVVIVNGLLCYGVRLVLGLYHFSRSQNVIERAMPYI
jgi:hypothetical protein